MLNQKISETLQIAKELYEYSVEKKYDGYLKDQLMQIIVNVSTLEDQQVGTKKIANNLTEEDEIQKVFRKIPRWIKNPSQYNSKILDTYMHLSNNNKNPVELVLLEAGSQLDSRKFLTNYTQMKIIAEKNHAKVFTEDSDMVYLWEPVSEFIEDLYEGIDTKFFDRVSKRKKHIHNKNNEHVFEKWLINTAKKDNGGSLDSGTIGTILSTLRSTIPKELKIDSILELNDLDIANDYLNKIETSDFNINNHYKPKQALKFYVQFLKNEKGIK